MASSSSSSSQSQSLSLSEQENSNINYTTMALAVQELVKKPLLTIPNFFICENQKDDGLNSDINGGNQNQANIPVIDMDLLISGQASGAMDDELLKMHSACKDWGFFQLVNHGKSSLVEKLKHEIEAFYKLPVEEKMKYKAKEGEKEGYGQTILQSQSQQHNQEKVDWADRFFMFVNPLHLRHPQLFPQLPSSLRETLEVYIQESQKLAMDLLEMMAKNLEIEKKEMEEMFENGLQSIRMTYYPPCPQPERVIGIRPHSDAGCITILLQVNGQDGLQVKKDGVWIPVHIIPGAFVVNIGDVFEIFSNGMYKSVEHKVTVNGENERISMGMFFLPKMEAEVGPAKTLMSKQINKALYKRISMNNFVNDFFSYKLNGKSFLESMKIQSANMKTD